MHTDAYLALLRGASARVPPNKHLNATRIWEEPPYGCPLRKSSGIATHRLWSARNHPLRFRTGPCLRQAQGRLWLRRGAPRKSSPPCIRRGGAITPGGGLAGENRGGAGETEVPSSARRSSRRLRKKGPNAVILSSSEGSRSACFQGSTRFSVARWLLRMTVQLGFSAAG